MTHLTPDEFVDLAEGVPAAAAAAHLDACDACRRQLTQLRATMSAAADADVPEPSPLFWDHLSARVREAVAAEGAPRAAWWRPSTWPRMAMPAAAGAVLAVAIAVAHSSRAPAPIALPVQAPTEAEVVAAPAPDAADDVSLNLVADLAAEMEWDAAGEIGLPMHAGVADEGMAELSAGERLEMRRLLQEAIGRPGG